MPSELGHLGEGWVFPHEDLVLRVAMCAHLGGKALRSTEVPRESLHSPGAPKGVPHPHQHGNPARTPAASALPSAGLESHPSQGAKEGLGEANPPPRPCPPLLPASTQLLEWARPGQARPSAASPVTVLTSSLACLDQAKLHTWEPVSMHCSGWPVSVFQKRMQRSAVPPPDASKPCW